MGAVLKLEDYPKDNRSRMVIPLREQVSAYMHEKMGWSKTFCDYYAERFWYHYQAQGWKLANGNLMKDWRAAFNSQWQRPKQKEDIAMLEECTKKDAAQKRKQSPEDYLNECLVKHKAGQYKPIPEELLGIFAHLKENGTIAANLTKQDIEKCVVKGGNSKDKMRMYCVRILFDKFIEQGKTFTNVPGK